MTIAEVGRQFGMSVDTLRYYERVGLIPPVHRNAAGHRDYQESDLNWVGVIQCMRGAGISVEALARYVGLFHQGDGTVEARRALLIEQRDGLQSRIAELEKALERLTWKIDSYDEMTRSMEHKLRGERPL